MTPEERENERLKLMANWFNTLATAIITAGTSSRRPVYLRDPTPRHQFEPGLWRRLYLPW
jgi:hypothetical protein